MKCRFMIAYGGGPFQEHRGFENYDLGPREENIYEIELVSGTKSLTTLELSIPLQGTQRGFRGVLFQTLVTSGVTKRCRLRTSRWRWAGVRFQLSSGIAGHGMVAQPGPDDDRRPFHFTMSQGF